MTENQLLKNQVSTSGSQLKFTDEQQLNLSPRIQKMIVEGNPPSGMTQKRLYGVIPVEREKQEEALIR